MKMNKQKEIEISIHAPLAGCDDRLMPLKYLEHNFNPRTPCGVRQLFFVIPVHLHAISIHAPLAGCDF